MIYLLIIFLTMSENLVNIPLESVLNGIDWVKNSTNTTVFNNVDLRCTNKIQIEYTRSMKDHIRSFAFFVLRVLVLVFIPLYCINIFGLNLSNIFNTNTITPTSFDIDNNSSILGKITPVWDYFSTLDWLLK